MKKLLAFDTCKLIHRGDGIQSLMGILSIRVFVDGRGRAEIMRDMQSRIKRRDVKLEKAAAIKVSFSNHPLYLKKLMTFDRLCATLLQTELESCFHHFRK